MTIDARAMAAAEEVRSVTDFCVLFVCTGNVCRSPFAEILMRHLLTQRLARSDAAAFIVGSAGTRAVVGSQIDPGMRDALLAGQLDETVLGCFAAQQIEPSMVGAADLILTVDRPHRSAVVELCPPAVARAFTLREFVRLIDLADPDALPVEALPRAHALVRSARMSRGLTPPVRPEMDAVRDPIGGNGRSYRDAASGITAAVQAIVDAIVGDPAGHVYVERHGRTRGAEAPLPAEAAGRRRVWSWGVLRRAAGKDDG
jgi:protein-tyrosine phosphatase